MKRGPKPKWKNEAQRKQMRNKYVAEWRKKNSEKFKEYQKKYYKKTHTSELRSADGRNLSSRVAKLESEVKDIAKKRGTPDVETRLSKLESEVKDILLDLEECLKENKRIENLVKYGGKK